MQCKFSYFHLSSGNRVAAYWEIAAHTAYDLFSKYKYLFVNNYFDFPTTATKNVDQI